MQDSVGAYKLYLVMTVALNAWFPSKGQTYTNLQLKAGGFFKHVWPVSGYQAKELSLSCQ